MLIAGLLVALNRWLLLCGAGSWGFMRRLPTIDGEIELAAAVSMFDLSTRM